MWSFTGEKQVSSFRTTHPSAAFHQLVDELSSADSTTAPSTAVGQKRKSVSLRKKSTAIRGVVGGDGEWGVTGEEEEEGEGEEAELFQDKQKSKQEARRLKKEMRKREVSLKYEVKGLSTDKYSQYPNMN